MSVDAGRRHCREGHEYPGWWQAECPECIKPQDNNRLKVLAHAIGKMERGGRNQFLSRAQFEAGYTGRLIAEEMREFKLPCYMGDETRENETQADVTHPDETQCEVCHRSFTGRGKVCSTCRVKAYRGRHG